ncbi:hypothetical protein V2I01_31590 [Micromonospora sp. BRA006-A]|nr:hypothetical protein [Micromonospora sp. BRA006-A]
MFVQANLSAGAFAQNVPIFNLYRNNVSAIAAWTSAHYPGRQGLCVPETMRFTGNGTWFPGNESCDSTIAPSYNSQTVTTGAEIGLRIWQTYLATDDRSFLSANYPVMSGAARFLLSHARTGSDGLLHTTSNAHETQWAVNDPITDVAAMQPSSRGGVRRADPGRRRGPGHPTAGGDPEDPSAAADRPRHPDPGPRPVRGRGGHHHARAVGAAHRDQAQRGEPRAGTGVALQPHR